MVRADMMQRVVDMRVERDIMAMADMAVAPDEGPAPTSDHSAGRHVTHVSTPGLVIQVSFAFTFRSKDRMWVGASLATASSAVGDCPEDRPYCHLKGGSTVCTEAGELLRDDCVNALDIPQPCADGLCNNSICQVPCVPGEENECPNEGRCVDISSGLA